MRAVPELISRATWRKSNKKQLDRRPTELSKCSVDGKASTLKLLERGLWFYGCENVATGQLKLFDNSRLVSKDQLAF
jgi:ssDNA-binding Zn-finger/Zn-ribbon topoisomerase 1